MEKAETRGRKEEWKLRDKLGGAGRISRKEKNASVAVVGAGTRVACAERRVHYLRGSQPAGIVIV